MHREAFVYCWTDHATNMLYIGYHTGREDDGYVCSSKYMMKEYNIRPGDFTRTIIAHGSREDMCAFEHKILKSVDARNSEQFYNKSNGGAEFYIFNHSEETKNKLSEIRKLNPLSGEKNGMFGKTHTPEAREKISKRPNTGKGIPKTEEHKRKLRCPKTEEHKRKISESHIGIGHTKETREKISAANKGKACPLISCIFCRRFMGTNNIKKHYKVCKNNPENQ